ncbi:MAG TPA: SCO family protein [Chitinivibrionales bacterium]
MRSSLCVVTVIIACAQVTSAYAHGGHSHAVVLSADSVNHGAYAQAASGEAPGIMGFDEKPGAMVALSLPFITETNDTVILEKLLKGPTILSLLYYRCPNACNTLLDAVAVALRSFSDRAAFAPNVITISIDEHETPADALKAKRIAFESIQNFYPPDHWRFLTASAASIKALTDAVGFKFVKNGAEFDHPLGLIILAPNGKVVRYITGTHYLPVDLTMSLMEASKGIVQPTIARVMRACFSYDPKSHRFVFALLRVSATVIFILLGSFILYLVISGHSRTKGRK